MISREVKKIIFLAVVFLTPVFLSACGSGVVGGSSTSLQREVDILKMEVADLKDQSRLGDLKGGRTAGSGDIRQDLDSLRVDLQKVMDNVETASLGGLSIRQQLEFLSARVDRLEKKVGLPPLSTSVLGPGAGTPIITGNVAVPTVPENSPPPVIPPAFDPEGSSPVPELPPAPPEVVKTDYDQGKDFFDQRNYKEAVTSFRSYLSAESRGTQAGPAQYYIGESLYFMNQFEDAILEYQTLIVNYPKNSLVSSALLKQGLSFQALGDKSSAKILYQKVVREYPKSYSAGVAKERLKTI